MVALGAGAVSGRVHLLVDRPVDRRVRAAADPRRLRELPGTAPADRHRAGVADRRRRHRIPGRPGDRRARDVPGRGPGVPHRPTARPERAGLARARCLHGARARPALRLVHLGRGACVPARARFRVRGRARARPAITTHAAPVRLRRRPDDACPRAVRRSSDRVPACGGRRRGTGAASEGGVAGADAPVRALRARSRRAARRRSVAQRRHLPLPLRLPRRPAGDPPLGIARRDDARLRGRLDHRPGRTARPLAGALPAPHDRRARLRRSHRAARGCALLRSGPPPGEPRGRTRDPGALRLLRRPSAGALLRPLRGPGLAAARPAPRARRGASC